MLLNYTARLAACIILALAILPVDTGAARDQSHSLAAIHDRTAASHADVRHVGPEKLAALLRDAGDRTLILDVRERDEHAVSRIPGAIRVSPGIWNNSFLRQFAEMSKNRTVVLYCSVGVRSTRLAARVQDALKKAGAEDVFNLQGGVFAWHNQKQPLADARGETDLVHPYNDYWGQLLERRNRISYRPRKASAN